VRVEISRGPAEAEWLEWLRRRELNPALPEHRPTRYSVGSRRSNPSSYFALPSLQLLESAHGPNFSPEARRGLWKAQWITSPTAPQRDSVVLRFRKGFDVSQVPEHWRSLRVIPVCGALSPNGHNQADRRSRAKTTV